MKTMMQRLVAAAFGLALWMALPVIAVGLLLQREAPNGEKPLPRVSFSLSRLQLGIWFVFALSAAILLGIVFWRLPALSGSILTLLGITVGTSGASMMMDTGTESAVGCASQGLLKDIVTGLDDRTHVHRYQAVAVNVMLLVVAITGVVKNLEFPTFDQTWMVFLVVSGVATAAGKQFVEKNP
jgi:hypothetical protein